MSLVEPTLFSLARAAVVAAATLVLMLAAGPGVRAIPRRMRAILFWIAIAALLAPGFGNAYLLQKRAMQYTEGGREVFYCALVWIRYASLALFAVWLMPSALSSEAMHCHRQNARPSVARRCVWELRVWGRGLWFGLVLVFLLSFQEFDFATTWNMRAWTVALFDAQAGGLALAESLRLALLPLVVQALMIAVLAMAIRDPAISEERGTMKLRVAVIAIFFPLLLVLICPVWISAVGSFVTVPAMLHSSEAKLSDLMPWREIANGVGISLAATLAAWLASGWISARRGLRWLLVLPGLLGPLLCGLMLLTAMQVAPFHLLRDTLFPTVIGLALVLLPFALILRVGIETTRDNVALHIARQSGARRSIWLLDGFPRLCALLLLFCFGYGDFTINSLLAPPAFISASVRLLNLLHYGQSAALGVMFVLSFAVPLIAVLLTAAIARIYARRRVR